MAIHPERYTAKDTKVSLKDIIAKSSIQDVVDHVLDSEISDLMRGSHTEQVKFVEDSLNVKIANHYERWPNFVEIFERRNLVAHGNLLINEIYLRNCKEAGLKSASSLSIGTSLELSPQYLRKSVDILLEFGILLVFTLTKKHVPNSDEQASTHFNAICYDLILSKKYTLAKNLLDFALNKQKRSCSDRNIGMITINLANCYRKMNKDNECKSVIDGLDWSASRDDFRM